MGQYENNIPLTKICYLFDESLRIFNAIPIKTNLEKSVSKRYGLRI